MSNLGVLIAYVPLALFRGWVISILWQWYVTDYFGLAPLTVIEAVGLGIVVSVFTPSPTPDDEKGLWYPLVYSLILTLVALTFGWLWSFAR